MPNWNVKPFKDWSAAVGGQQANRDEKFTQLRASLPAATVPDEKDLAKYTTDLITLSYSNANAAEIRQLGEWLRATMAWGNWNLDITRQILGRLHKKKTKASAGDRTAERTRVTNWLQTLYAEGGVAKQHFNAFTSELSKKLPAATAKTQMAALLAPGFFSSAQVLVGLGGPNATNFPDWFPQAIEHRTSLPGGSVFWLSTTNDIAQIREIGDKLYANDDWKAPNAVGANQYATALAADPTGRLGAMFPSLTRWLEVANEGAAQHIQDLPQKLIEISQRRTVALDQAILGNLGTWIWRNREAVLTLIANGYSPEVIAKMHERNLAHREIITITWFRGERAIVNDDAMAVGFKMRNSANNGDIHGWVFGPTRHLAERHLYRHFQFNGAPEAPWDTPIKDQNSFHPQGTEQLDLANLREHIKLPFQEKNQNRTVDVNAQGNNYQLNVDTNHGTQRVRTLYPRLGGAHRDFYTRNTLERMREVAALFPVPYQNALPETPWFDAPR